MKITHVLKPFALFMISIISLSTIQWSCIRLLAIHCHSNGFQGFFMNPLLLGSPMCIAINSIQINLAKYYISIFSTIITVSTAWIIQILSFPKIVQHQELIHIYQKQNQFNAIKNI